MSEQTFQPGDIVYHKANNLRMVVLSSGENYTSCRCVNINGTYDEINFKPFELSKSPIFDNEVPVVAQLETRKNS